MAAPRVVQVAPDGREISGLIASLSAGRFVLGLAGAPGAGKTTLAAAVAAEYGVPVVPMDGFHRPEAELLAMGRLEAKGAPDTFDAAGYAALLSRVRASDAAVLAPAFDHRQPDPIPDAIAVPADAELVVTEGNYLLLDRPEWRAARDQCDAVWHLVSDERERFDRLVRRHVESGKVPAQARAYVERVDQPNARLVEAAGHRADLVLDLTTWVASGFRRRPG